MALVPTPRWVPLECDEELRAAAIAVLMEIAAALERPVSRTRGRDDTSWAFDLLNGSAGTALLFAYLRRASLRDPVFGDPERWATLASDHLDHAIEGVSSLAMPPSLGNGFTGVAWSMAHLGELLDLEIEIPESIDTALVELVSAPWTGNFDLIVGLTGLGVYFLDRLPDPQAVRGLEQIVERLDELAHRDEHGVAWFTPPSRVPEWQRAQCPEGYFDLGVAHGLAGVVGLLVSVDAAGIAKARARELLEAAMSWLLAHSLGPAEEAGFPWAHLAGAEPVVARSAWCYGDPGIATVLARAGAWLERPEWTRRADALLRAAAAHPRGIVDACVCHGSAGFLLMLQRAWQRDRSDPVLAQALREWLAWTLESRVPGEGVAGFRTAIYENGETVWITEHGVLEGAAGVGLALLALVSEVAPDWDRILSLSGVETAKR